MGGTYDHKKIKKKCFLYKKDKLFYMHSGFIKELLTFVKGKFKITELKDKRTKFEHSFVQFSEEDLLQFFPKFDYLKHQTASLQKMLKTNVGIIEAPTSSGKTETIIAFIKATKLPTLILVDKVSLAVQTRDRILKNGIKDVGLCYGKGVQNGFIMVSTIGSVKKIPNLRKFKVLIIDEVHNASAGRFQDFLSSTSYPLRYGFSATPHVGDEYRWYLIKQYMGDIIYSIDPKPLMEHKVLAKPIIKFVPIESVWTIDWPTANRRCIIENNKRNKKIKELVEEHDTTTLILIRNIDHGEILNEMIPGSVFVSGVDDAMKRQEIINQFEDGVLKTVISSNIFNEGISINAIRLLIIASGGKSKRETIQKLGRGLRVKEGKFDVIVIDFDDYDNKYTERHSDMRKKIYEKAGFEVVK
jgi:superfamily II DNA or RNA helicase